ncbi:MAG: glutamine--scyllo-inositol aminotransferase [Verrucomicrobia bacterium GWC2_42_7]|nr:MAG: glutamine--scyllo-inositol aminotransferase [Verrucomicrobia bacterium GWC2_42_7]
MSDCSSVPLLDLKRQNLAIEDDLLAAFKRVLHSGHYILGEEILGFESEVAALIGVKHAISVSSGTDAILLALMTLGIGPGDEVLCPAFTFFATAGCVVRVGATPVWVDVNEVDFNIAIEDAKSKITDRTKAIIPVPLFGQACDMDAIMDFAKAKQLFVIEDAAQSMGATFKGKTVGSIGHFGCYSFFPSKNLGGFGDSGMLVTNDDALAEKARLLRTHGSHPKYFHKYVGANFRMDALQAALLRVKLPLYADFIKKRTQNAAFYTQELQSLSEHLILPVALAHNTHIWNQYTLRIKNGKRTALKAHLEANKIGCDIYYPLTLDQQECFRGMGKGENSIKVAHTLADQCLSIPIFPELQTAELQYVVKTIKSFF